MDGSKFKALSTLPLLPVFRRVNDENKDTIFSPIFKKILNHTMCKSQDTLSYNEINKNILPQPNYNTFNPNLNLCNTKSCHEGNIR